MHKKLSDEKLKELIAAGISEFACKGFEHASISSIAQKSGISVGVIYKYYDDKEALFIACVRDCLQALNSVLDDVTLKSDSIDESIRSIITTLIGYAKENTEINRMYHEITSSKDKMYTNMLAGEIEGISAVVYTNLIKKAKEQGLCHVDADPRFFAFFFDNLFMMVQFSYCSDYYRERFRLYCGMDINEADDQIANQLGIFIKGALGINK